MSSSKSFGNPLFVEKLGAIASIAVHMPLVLFWTLLGSPFHSVNQFKSWKRILSDRAFHHLTKQLNVRQLQWLLGTSRFVYENWAKWYKLPIVVDEIGGDSRLFWIGERRTDRVILYLHGGAYMLPMFFFGLTFWKRTVLELKTRGVESGFAILNYSLVPTADFPTQLKQAALALEYLISQGVNPENIQLVGDSAGGNLLLELISHLLHPLNGVSRIKLSSPLCGAYLMSPWVSLSGHGGSLITNDSSDMIGTECLSYWGRIILHGVPDLQIPYIEAIKAPEPWFKQINTVVDRVLITAGEAECLRDEIIVVANQIYKDHKKTKFVIHKNGIHNDPYFDFLTMEPVGEVTPIIWDWLAAGFTKS